MVKIYNENLEVSINELGAVLTSIIDKNKGEELLYQVEKDSWPFQDVVIFPIIGATTYKLNEFKLNSPTRHGFIRNMIFNIKEINNDEVTLSLSSNEETLTYFPYNFNFEITYKVIKNTLKVSTKVTSLNNKEIMYFMYGSHSALKANEKAFIELDDNYNQLKLINGLISLTPTNIHNKRINLTKDYFKKEDTVIIENKFNKVTLNNGYNHLITYEFDAPLFALWSKPNDIKFICIEPWWGISNISNEILDLKDINYINQTKNVKEFNYSLTFNSIN